VVVLADIGKAFNETDLRADIILDEQFGLCPLVKPPHTGTRYPSLPYWLARRRQRRELLGEELRLLYVGMTRARDLLLLCGSIPSKRWQKLSAAIAGINAAQILAARSYADWLGLWFWKEVKANPGQTRGVQEDLAWVIHDDRSAADVPARDLSDHRPGATEKNLADANAWARLDAKLAWEYPYSVATTEPAKTSVTQLRRAASDLLEDTTPAAFLRLRKAATASPGDNGPSAVEKGLAHHKFLQHFAVAQGIDAAILKAEAERMVAEGLLTLEEQSSLNLNGIGQFWNSPLGRRIAAHQQHLRRELPFTARFAPSELPPHAGAPHDPSLQHEFVVIQGVADAAVIMPGEIWLVDFKTDSVTLSQAASRARIYEPQLRLYAEALSRIYNRPVTELWLWFLHCGHGVSFPQTC
jgi:ATP-dependent helicase/nuclease subunit A